MDTVMKMSSNDFTDYERSILIHCLKRRIENLNEFDLDTGFSKSTEIWRKEYYYPVIRSIIKLEDDKERKVFTKTEKLMLNSCINEEIANRKNESIMDEEIMAKLFVIIRKINK